MSCDYRLTKDEIESIRVIKDALVLRGKVVRLPLSAFRAQDLPALLRVLGARLQTPLNYNGWPTRDDV